MDLELDAVQRAFRDEARDWLAANNPREELPPMDSKEGVEAHREWEKKLFAAGLAAVHWPAAYGGRGMDPLCTALFFEEYIRAGAPERLNRLGLALAGPTLIDVGSQEQQARWLSRILSCDDLWCQGFSEPSAGSDLASVRTRGEVGESGILVNGQKIWTSYSLWADWMFTLVRTDPDAPKHRGLTFVMIDMKDPGVEVRPIVQINGQREFGEVFLTDVAVPMENVVGGIGNGWKVATRTLSHERGAGTSAEIFASALREVVDMLPAHLRSDPRIREEVGAIHEAIEAYRYMSLRTLSELARHKNPGPQAAMGKLCWSQMQNRIYELGMRVLGPAAELEDGADGDQAPPLFRARYWTSRAALIYAGTTEIQRNIIAERVLGLPKG
ncbi:acyl-CoA dehydrogenase family protein [Mycobacterium sp. smrl_JER01]|uniref:acyl-CoA dehydrogenase family protein n=1 Tax=Mycobacterium sp. smrl_JER01 TaxID=3402633 RepID=UPI003ACFFD26